MDGTRHTGHNITAWSEMSPVRHSDGNDSQDEAEDPHEDHGATQCCLPLSTGGAPVCRPRGSWSAHPGAGAGPPSSLSHILPQSSHLTARLNVTPAQVGSENCSLVNIQRSVAMFAGRLTRYFLFTIQPSLITVTKISVLGYYDNSDFLLSKYRSIA